jgi:hypothetical protein
MKEQDPVVQKSVGQDPVDNLLIDEDIALYLQTAIATPIDKGGLGGLEAGKEYTVASLFLDNERGDDLYRVYMVNDAVAMQEYIGSSPAFYLDKANQLGSLEQKLKAMVDSGQFDCLFARKMEAEEEFAEYDQDRINELSAEAQNYMLEMMRSDDDKSVALDILARLCGESDVEQLRNAVIAEYAKKDPPAAAPKPILTSTIIDTLELTEGDLLEKLSIIFNKDKTELETSLAKEYYLTTQLKDQMSITGPVQERLEGPIIRKLLECDVDIDKIDRFINPVDGKGSHDVFDEILPHIEDGELHHKVLMSYNTGGHWMPLEILINKDPATNEYTVEISAHDPFGPGKYELKNGDQVYQDMVKAITNRIKSEDANATINASAVISPYARRQAVGDGTSCGGHTRAGMIQRAKGEALAGAQPKRAIDMLTAQTQFVKTYGAAAGIQQEKLGEFVARNNNRVVQLSVDEFNDAKIEAANLAAIAALQDEDRQPRALPPQTSSRSSPEGAGLNYEKIAEDVIRDMSEGNDMHEALAVFFENQEYIKVIAGQLQANNPQVVQLLSAALDVSVGKINDAIKVAIESQQLSALPRLAQQSAPAIKIDNVKVIKGIISSYGVDEELFRSLLGKGESIADLADNLDTKKNATITRLRDMFANVGVNKTPEEIGVAIDNLQLGQVSAALQGQDRQPVAPSRQGLPGPLLTGAGLGSQSAPPVAKINNVQLIESVVNTIQHMDANVRGLIFTKQAIDDLATNLDKDKNATIERLQNMLEAAGVSKTSKEIGVAIDTQRGCMQVAATIGAIKSCGSQQRASLGPVPSRGAGGMVF